MVERYETSLLRRAEGRRPSNKIPLMINGSNDSVTLGNNITESLNRNCTRTVPESSIPDRGRVINVAGIKWYQLNQVIP